MAVEIYALDTQYVGSNNCSVPTIPITFYFEGFPTATVKAGGAVICDAPKYEFRPPPFGYDEGAGLVIPTPGILFEDSNYAEVSDPRLVDDPRNP